MRDVVPRGRRATTRRVLDLVVAAASLGVVVAASGPVRSTASTSASPTAEPTSTLAAPSAARSRDEERPAPRVEASLAAFGCDVRDRGLGDHALVRTDTGADVLVAQTAVLPDGSYDLVVHFHGREPFKRTLGPTTLPVVGAAIDRGDSSGDYAGMFRGPRDFEALVASIDSAVTEQVGRPARARSILLSSFSAGFEAIREALGVVTPAPDGVSGVLLLDSLYGSYVGGTGRVVDAERLAPFETLARRALVEPRLSFILTHSDVPTDGYASTREVADALLERLVVRVDRTRAAGTRALTRRAEEKGLVVRGYAGEDRDAHCAHLALLPELVELWQGRSRGER
jgi:hypothetical protein